MATKITIRDYEYITNRLYDPAPNAMEAHTRLIFIGQAHLAADVMAATKEFQDKIRQIRYRLDEINLNQLDGK